MANKLPVGESVSFGIGKTIKRPELASLIGSICSDWAYLENTLGRFYSLLLGVYLDAKPGSEPPTHPVAHQIFDEVQTIHARVNLVVKLAEWVIKDKVFFDEVKTILEKLRKAGKGRNKIAHAIWGVCNSEPEALIFSPAFGYKLIYKKNDFELIQEQIKSANYELQEIVNKFYKIRKEINP